jgi:hypothetical protein
MSGFETQQKMALKCRSHEFSFSAVAFLRLTVAFMDPFGVQMHVSWHHAIDKKQVCILVKFERRLSIPVLRIKSFFKKKKG